MKPNNYYKYTFMLLVAFSYLDMVTQALTHKQFRLTHSFLGLFFERGNRGGLEALLTMALLYFIIILITFISQQIHNHRQGKRTLSQWSTLSKKL
jgi:hypothetical protein